MSPSSLPDSTWSSQCCSGQFLAAYGEVPVGREKPQEGSGDRLKQTVERLARSRGFMAGRGSIHLCPSCMETGRGHSTSEDASLWVSVLWSVNVELGREGLEGSFSAYVLGGAHSPSLRRCDEALWL